MLTANTKGNLRWFLTSDTTSVVDDNDDNYQNYSLNIVKENLMDALKAKIESSSMRSGGKTVDMTLYKAEKEVSYVYPQARQCLLLDSKLVPSAGSIDEAP